MLKTVRDACKPHESVFADAKGDQIEDLARLISDAGDGADFFAKNYITAGMGQLFELGLRRLAGKSDQAVFELTQAMGGGKTHTMIALGLVARSEALRARVVPDLARGAPFQGARVAAFTGRSFPDHFFWGEIAVQLGKETAFKKFWKDGPEAPDEAAWRKLLGDEPNLILLDELPAYFDYAQTRPAGGGTVAQVATYALSNLLMAALNSKRTCVVISNLSGTYENASKELRRAIRNAEQETRRQAKPITPVELGGSEIYQILRKRLFETLPGDDDVATVAQAFARAITEAERSKTIAKSSEQIAAEIHGSYPFHPSIKDVIALFRNNESYRQTRGLMQFVSQLIRSVWRRPANDVHLIGLQHLNVNDPDARAELNQISDLRGAISKDVAAGGASHAETIDAQTNSDAGSQVATLLLTASLSTAVDAVKGLTKQRALECLIAPNRSVHEFAEAFDHLVRDAWYLHRDHGESYYFSNIENLTKRLADEAERAPANKIDAEMRRRLETIFAPRRKAAYQELRALPVVDQVRLNGPRVLLILSPDTKTPPEDARRFYDSVVEKNNLCVLTGDGSDMTSLEAKTRDVYAVAKLKAELPESSPLRPELDEKLEQVEHEWNATVTATFNRVYYPLARGLTRAKLAMTFEGNAFDGEAQIERALTSTGVSKLALSVEEELTAHLSKAEDLLWPPSQRRVPWRDVKARALSNPSWTWLPKDGLELLRDLAVQRGRWRHTDDGYVEKGPFEKEKTSVTVVERGYDEETGRAALEVQPVNAGPGAQVFWDTKPEVTTKSQRLTDSKLETAETHVWFLAVDRTGGHETGPAVLWTNRLTITHQPRAGVGKRRTVELRVVPRGTIRYTLNGANPAEGEVYTGPIEIGPEAAQVFSYAEEKGVTAKRTFSIPKAGEEGLAIDLGRPAKLRKSIPCGGTPATFELLARTREIQARIAGASLDVGLGSKAASLRFGSDAAVTAEALEDIVRALRGALGDEAADVRLTARTIEFLSGHDLDAFVRERGLDVAGNEVEQ